jgi:carboxyl-terminal processing protease
MIDNQPDYSTKKKFKLSDLFTKLVVIVLIFAFGVWVGQNVVLPFGKNVAPKITLLNQETPEDIQVDFAPFWDVWQKVTTEYLERNKIDPQKLLYGSISGMVDAVGDPYTVFLDPTDNQEFELSLAGTYVGIGIELSIRDEKLVVVAPIKGTPADKAGILPGDFVLGINGEGTAELSIQDAVKKIRGEKDSEITLTLQRGGKVFDVKMVREQIVLKSVEFDDLGDGVAHVKITRFGDETLKEWNSEIGKLVSQGFKKIVLDMRNNPGGRLDQAISIAGDFVPKGSTILQEEDVSARKVPFKSDVDPRLEDVQVVVLINKGSASASEIVAGALSDLRKIRLIGETSFGKGTVQRVDDLPDGSGLHLTFAKWLTPNGTWVHDKGLKPDVEVKMTEEDIKANKDPQLEKAKELLR